MRQLNLVLLFISGAAILSTTLYFQLFAGEHLWDSPTYLPASDKDELLCAPGARYLDPKQLMAEGWSSPDSHNGLRIPRLIHQSWIDKDLPVKFSKWSDTLRLRHPEWRWVLWTDADNAELVSSRHPHLNQTYWALRNNIQRADFVRNLYMWEFGGVYADLDMECLRPLDTLFSPPFIQINPSYPIVSASLTHNAAIAFVGSMEAPPETRHHSMPNAFMASTPRHPLWLLPLSRVLTDYHADIEGKAAQADYSGTAEATTGPEALLHSVETYRAWRGESRPLSTETHIETSTIFHPTVAQLISKAAEDHEVVVLDTSVIYPFSWLGDVESEVHQTCRAAPGMPFDPIRCQEVCKAYERGARMITYWSHTWQQQGEHKDLDVVGY